jgi:hypothetical protein
VGTGLLKALYRLGTALEQRQNGVSGGG